MTIELMPDLEQRAAVHAALGDPARLAVVERLYLGDASPSELGAELGLPSNLLAHHLRVLEEHGLISRRRSEGDKRRSYLRLERDLIDQVVPAAARRAGRVVFICTANSARSQLAVVLWRRSSRIPATSAGTHPAPTIHPGAIDAARRHGLKLAQRRPRELADVVGADDFVISVCDNAYEELDGITDLHWSVPDPVPQASPNAFDSAFDELSRRISQVAPHMTGARP
jgi:protein-tyrosine-phosphatase/DNA-binding HxlR family transcriptional regulator